MSRLLIPRISLAQAVERFAQLQELVRSGNAGRALVLEEDVGAVPNRTGGSAPTPDDIHRWREEVTARVDDVSIDPFEGRSSHRARVTLPMAGVGRTSRCSCFLTWSMLAGEGVIPEGRN